MKILVNPIGKLLERAEQRVNIHYQALVQDLTHDRKRALALAVLAGADPSPDFAQAATIEGLSPHDLAILINSKPDSLMVRENARRATIVRLRKATTAAELDQILDGQGVPRYQVSR